jgi:DNA-binding transcriptional LysR family regulator
MTANPLISLEQWRALIAVVDSGSYARAATALHKSQSALTYAVQRLEELLGVKVFEIKGRKAVLTETGHTLYLRGRQLLDEAVGVERAAHSAAKGWEAEIAIAVEIIFPSWLFLKALARFAEEAPHTRIEVIESVIGGAPDALTEGRVDLALTPEVPSGYSGEILTRMRFVPAAHPSHPLFQLGRALTMRDLRKHRRLLVRDTSTKRDKRLQTVEAEQRWTFGLMATSLQAARMGFGFAWYPQEKIREEIARGELKILPLKEKDDRFADIYLVLADAAGAGPGVRRLAQILKDETQELCAKQSK